MTDRDATFPVSRHSPAWFAHAARVLLASALTVLSLPAGAFDENGIRFGPAGTGAASPGSVDREFVREWEKNPPPGYPTLSPANVGPTKAAIKRYQDIVAKGGWETVPNIKLFAGETHFAVAVLKRRLTASGDLKGSDETEFFDTDLEAAVKRFQATNGLTPTGIVDERTAVALNVPADARLRQLRNSLARLQEYIGSTPKQKYVAVNIPAAQVEAVEGDKVVSRHTGVVGKPERPTPILRTAIHEMNFNPVWRLPPTVITKDLIPRGREMQKDGKNVLVKFGIDAYDGAGKKVDPEKINWASSQPSGLSYRQKPGKDNPLGFLKINFNNSHSVYMHDTPSESMFGRNFRAASSGCIRVANIETLAAWLLAGTPGWSASRIETVKENGERVDAKLKKPVPLYFAYLTAWATPDGVIQFRRDLYDRDRAGADATSY
jgi:murein L,D-transpeptidase YcbB/YkuD